MTSCLFFTRLSAKSLTLEKLQRKRGYTSNTVKVGSFVSLSFKNYKLNVLSCVLKLVKYWSSQLNQTVMANHQDAYCQDKLYGYSMELCGYGYISKYKQLEL